jgi:hypothetical protein
LLLLPTLLPLLLLFLTVLQLTYSPIPLNFAALLKYAEQMAFRTMSQSLPQLVRGSFCCFMMSSS